jgi:hypothetical protein
MEHAEIKKRVRELGERLDTLSAQFSQLSDVLRVSPDGSMRGEPRACSILHELPDAFVADFLRGIIAEYRQARGRLLDTRSQLECYGIE